MSTTASAVTAVHLRDICKITSGMPSSRAKARDEAGKELMSVTYPSIQSGFLDQTAFQPIRATDRAFESLAVPGTILLKSVPPFAATLVPEGIGDLFVGSNVIVLSVLPNAPVTAGYLVAYLNSELGALNLEMVQAGASGALKMIRTSS